MPDPEYMVPLTLALGDVWPSDLVEVLADSPIADVLGQIGVVRLEVSAPAGVAATLMFRNELVLEMPGVAGLEFVFGSDSVGHTRVDLRLSLSDPFFIGIDDFPIQLRFPREALRPVIEEADGTFSADPDPDHAVAIGIEPSIGFSGDGTVSLSGLDEIEISTRFMIADSGIVLDIPRIALHLTEGEEPPAGLPEGWRGVFIERATVHLPRAIDVESLPDAIEFEQCGIGSGGFTGEVAADWSDALSATLLGFTARLNRLEFAFQQNAFLRSEVEGEIDLSFFEATVGLQLSLGADGEFSAALSAVPPRAGQNTATETADGLIQFTLPQLLTVTVESMRFDNIADVFRFTISGRFKPLLVGLDWPTFDIESLSIDEHGNVDFEGGWLELPQQQTLDFHAFQISISEIGFGSEDDTSAPVPDGGRYPIRQWVGVSGSIRLVEGLPISASVEGMKVSWRPDVAGGDPKVSIEGIGISLETPGTLSLTGQVRYETIDDEHLQGDIFRGSVDLNLMALRARVGGELIIGHLTEPESGEAFDVAFVVLNAEFPAAIPLSATGAGLYGLKGMVGVNIAPDRAPSAEDPAEPASWYEWYKAPPERDVTAIDKWTPRRDTYALGAGLTIGTIYDDGYTINARALLALLLPGPIIILEGRANLVKSRSEDSAESGAFYLLAVIDCSGGTFQLNIDVQYEIADVIRAGGGVEAFFDFNDSTRWHVWLGQKEPDTKRIGGDILSLFRVSLYLMIDANGMATGAKAALEVHKRYGPLAIHMAVGLRFDAAIFWKPTQAEGAIELFGQLGITIFGIGLGIALRLLLEARAATPFWVHGIAHFAVTLPFPLPSFEATVQFTWEEPIPPTAVWPLLRTIELTHHLRSESRWTPSRSEAGAPVVPVDAVPIAKFARPLAGRSYRRDGAAVELLGIDRIGEWTFTYACEAMTLSELRADGRWHLVAEAPFRSPDVSDVVPLDFSDESLITGTDAQEPVWRLWTHERLPGASVYEREDRPARDPACPPAIQVATCLDFATFANGSPFPRHFKIRDWELRCPELPITRGGRLETSELWVRFPRAMGRIEVRYAGNADIRAFRAGAAVALPPTERNDSDSLRDWWAEIQEGIDTLWIQKGRAALEDAARVSIQRICASPLEELEALQRVREAGRTAERDDARPGRLRLKPRTRYRLDCRTNVYQTYQTDGRTTRHEASESFYFETSDGPGANPLNDGERRKLAACHAAGMGPAPHADFLGGTPHDTAAPYIQRTYPGPDDDPFHYELDPAILFDASYFPELYHPSWSLVLRLRDRNNAILGERVVRRAETRLPRTSPGDVTWEAARLRGGCASAIAGHALEGDTGLSADGLALMMRPNRRYTVELVLRGCLERVIHSFPLTTSRYQHPEKQLVSGVTGGIQVVRSTAIDASLTAVPAAAIATARTAWRILATARVALDSAIGGGSRVAIFDALEAARSARSECDRICVESFAVITTALGQTAFQPRPPRTEVVALTAPDGMLLMVESAEPIDWQRWAMTAAAAGATPRPVVACANADRTRTLLIPSDDPVAWTVQPIDLELTYRSVTDAPDLFAFTRSGVTYAPASVHLHCGLPADV